MTSQSLGESVSEGATILRRAGVESARREARLLLGFVIGQPVEWLIAHPEAPNTEIERYRALIARREAREPLSHILGKREFWSREFLVNEAVLDPRADSETLIEAALDRVPISDQRLRILDLGTGSGCLLVTMLCERPNAVGVGVDRSMEALRVAQRNIERWSLTDRAKLVCADWTTSLAVGFDLVLSNPPYIPKGEIEELAPEVAQFDPRAALDGGDDGLDAYRLLAVQILPLISADGVAVIELGAGQESDVQRIFADAGWGGIETVLDLAAHPRCLIAQR